MKFEDYEREAARTMRPPHGTTDDEVLAWHALGLTGEAGEVADAVKKMVFHKHGLNVERLEAEMGDVLWYLSALARVLGTSLERVAQRNIRKLHSRYPNGFSTEASLARRDEQPTGREELPTLPEELAPETPRERFTDPYSIVVGRLP